MYKPALYSGLILIIVSLKWICKRNAQYLEIIFLNSFHIFDIPLNIMAIATETYM